jgi:protein-serine/threonine kinase
MGLMCCYRSVEEPSSPPKRKPESPIENLLVSTSKKPQLEDFEMLSTLGKGSFAKVVLVRYKGDTQLYAMKILKKKEITARNEEDHIRSERKILEDAKSPFVVKLKWAFQNNRKLYFVMEFMPGGELFFHLSKAHRFNESIARFYISEVIIGLEYLHNLGIIYRDLKPENILLGLDGHIKLTDFGLSKVFTEKISTTRTICGTPEYQAPEIIMCCEYDKAVDFWSIGCLMYELISGNPPFQGTQREYLRHIIMNENPKFSSAFSEAAKNLIVKLLEKNVRNRQPEYRLTDFKRVKAHEFFDGINWEDVEGKKGEAPYKPKQSSGTDNFDSAFVEEPPLSANMSPSPQSNLAEFPGFTYKEPSLIH